MIPSRFCLLLLTGFFALPFGLRAQALDPAIQAKVDAQITQDTAAHAQESARATEELQTQAEQLRAVSTRLALLVGLRLA